MEVEQEVDRILFEMYGKYLKHYDKKCDTFCGDSCLCKKRIKFTEQEWIRREVKNRLRV